MSEHHDGEQLDRRAQAAAAEVHASAAARTRPPFDPDRPAPVDLVAAPTRPIQRIVAVAAVVVLVVAGGALWANRPVHRDDKANVVSGDPRPFVAGPLPDGFSLIGAGEITANGAGGGRRSQLARMGPLTIFGSSLDDPQLGIALVPSWTRGSATADDVKPITVDGTTVFPYDGMGIGTHVVIAPKGDTAVVLVSPTMTDRWLAGLAAQVTVAADGTVDLHGHQLPEDWHVVGQLPNLLGLANPMAATMDPTAVGKYAIYQRGGTSTTGAKDSGDQSAPDPVPSPAGADSLYVSSTPGDELELRASALVADHASAVRVRGHDGLLTSIAVPGLSGPDPLRTVTWIEEPGELLRVTATGLSERQLLDVAEGLERPGAARWKDLIERSQMGEFDPANAGESPKTKVGEGRFDDGTRWILSFSTDGTGADESVSVRLAVAYQGTGDSSTSSTSGSVGSSLGAAGAPIPSSTIEDHEDRSFGAALLAPAVARVEVRDADGKVLARPEIIEGGGQRGMAVEVPDGAAVLVALDAKGTELGRVDFARSTSGGSGSSSGSSSGSGSTSGSGSGGSATTVVGD